MTDRNRQRLTELMEARKEELGRTWREIADLGGLTDETLRQVRNGTGGIQRKTRRGIDAGMDWVTGKGVDSILAGHEPTPRVTSPSPPAPTGARLQDSPFTAEEALSFLRVRYEEYGDGGFWLGFDEIYAARKNALRTSDKSPSNRPQQSA